MLALSFIIGGGLTASETLPIAGGTALGIILGIPLALQGWAGWRGRPALPFQPKRSGWLWLALAAVYGLGTLISSLSLAPAVLLPPVHVLAMALPPLLVLRMVGYGLQGRNGSRREVWAGATSGGTLAIGGAVLSEVLVAFILVFVAVLVALTIFGGSDEVMALTEKLQDPFWLADQDNLLNLLLSPPVALSLLGLFSIPVPLIEELLKTLVGGIAARWVRPSPARAFLWGVASGAGFALAENLLNGALGGVDGWALGALARFGATVMHCFTGGIVGWGWGEFWRARRLWRLLGSYFAAVTIHGVWNAAGVGVALMGVSALMNGGKTSSVLMEISSITLVGMLGGLTLMFLLALIRAGRRLA